MAEFYQVAVVGGGPAGISAAVAAAEAGLSHILIERAGHLADTVYRYQKRKEVMAHPERLPLLGRVPLAFSRREAVLDGWEDAVARAGVTLRLRAEVMSISGSQGAFTIRLGDGSDIGAANVVLGIGLQGNLRRLGIPGEDSPMVQYELADAEAYRGETIVVIGGGDSGIENALALAEQNTVIMVNRQAEFARAKPGNLAGIERAVRAGKITCYYRSQAKAIEDGAIVLRTGDGEARIPCDRVIARLGATPPRSFVEACGVTFPSRDPAAVPWLSPVYESNVPGLYIVGALAGGQLIKQALNQGYEVIQTILGTPCEPADYQPLKANFVAAFPDQSVESVLALVQWLVPMLKDLTLLQLREFLLESPVRVYQPGEVVFRQNDYSTSIYSILEGGIEVAAQRDGNIFTFRLGAGEFFGEMALLTGRRRTGTVTAVGKMVALETPRRSLLRLMSSVESVREEIDRVAVRRLIQLMLGPGLGMEELEEVIGTARLERFAANQALMVEGDPCDAMYLIRSGSVTVSGKINDREVVLSYVAAGNFLGERGILEEGGKRSATARAAIATDALRIDAQPLRRLMDRYPALRYGLERRIERHYGPQFRRLLAGEDSGLVSFLVQQGVSEATDVLLIDETLCVHCDNCEKACAETHDGVSRLDRAAGPSYAAIHVPTSCRHCEHPHCMVDCPPDAIHRAASGEVYIADNCIGCGNCERNCPYGVIHMASPPEPKPGLWSWLLFGKGPGPGGDKQHRNGAATNGGEEKSTSSKRAVKCDLCRGIEGGPACVRACPTGAAIRANPEEFFSLVNLAQAGGMK